MVILTEFSKHFLRAYFGNPGTLPGAADRILINETLPLRSSQVAKPKTMESAVFYEQCRGKLGIVLEA